MRILVVCTDLGVRIPSDKGASVHLQAISEAFAEEGHDVLLTAVRGHGVPAMRVASVLLPHPGRAEGLRRELRKLRFVARFPMLVEPALDRFEPDLVYERLSLFGTAGIVLARRYRAPHVVEVNALLAVEEAKWRGLRLASLAHRREGRVLQRATLRVAVSQEVAAQVQRVAGARPTIVVPNGVSASAFDELPARADARAQLGLPAGRRMMCFVGALRPWHGLDLALRALTYLPTDVDLVIAGDGPVRGSLEAEARVLGVGDRVHWLGHVEHGLVPTVLAAADVAIAPYPASGDFAFSPLKIYEYLAAGVPVVASDIGQIRSALGDGRFGALVPAGDVAAFVSAVSTTLSGGASITGAARAARAHTLATHDWRHRASAIIAGVEEVSSRALAH